VQPNAKTGRPSERSGGLFAFGGAASGVSSTRSGEGCGTGPAISKYMDLPARRPLALGWLGRTSPSAPQVGLPSEGQGVGGSVPLWLPPRRFIALTAQAPDRQAELNSWPVLLQAGISQAGRPPRGRAGPDPLD